MKDNQEINWPPVIFGGVILFTLVWVASQVSHPGWVILGGLAILAFASFAKNNF